MTQTWTEDIITALRALGGDAHYADLYAYMKKNSSHDFSKRKDPNAQIRGAIESKSSDSTVFKGNPGDENDLFIRKGSGHWGLRKASYPEETFDIHELNKISKQISHSRLANANKYNGKIQNFAQINKEKSRIGLLGERLVVKQEKEKLEKLNRSDLSDKVTHVSQTKGDGLGYDVLSFDKNGSEMFIEVKTTTKGQDEPFFVSDNELCFSKDYSDKYYLYRIYNLDNITNSKKADYFIINGNLEDSFTLTPRNYIVKQK